MGSGCDTVASNTSGPGFKSSHNHFYSEHLPLDENKEKENKNGPFLKK